MNGAAAPLAYQVSERSPIARALSTEERAAWYWQGRPVQVAQRAANDAGYHSEYLSWLLLRWRVDPVCYAREALRVNLHPYQAQILLDLADAPADLYVFYGLDASQPKRQVLVPSGHGLGKTRVLAIAILWHRDTHRFSKTIATAPTADQLTGQLWGEIRKLSRRLKKAWPEIAEQWEILGSSIVHRDPDLADWQVIARTARADRPEGMQGAHALDVDDEFGELAELFGEEPDSGPSGGILVIAEEASGIDDSIREVLEGALSEDGARLLAPGNPTRPDGWFARDIERRDRYAVHHLDCRQSNREQVYSLPYRDFAGRVYALRIRGFVRPSYWLDIIRECDGDEDADRVRVRVRGLTPRSATEQVIRTTWVEAAQARQPAPGAANESAVIGLDCGLSGDKHASAVRRGYWVADIDEWLPRDRPEAITLDLVDRALELQRVHRARTIVIDNNGVGRGAYELLCQYFHDQHPELGVRVIGFNAGAGAADAARYPRRRDEMWFKHGRPFCADPRCVLPAQPGLKSQLCAPGYSEGGDKKIRVESKQDVKRRLGLPSGNAADAVLMTLMVRSLAPAPAPTVDPYRHPPAFEKHFARLRARADSGRYIR